MYQNILIYTQGLVRDFNLILFSGNRPRSKGFMRKEDRVERLYSLRNLWWDTSIRLTDCKSILRLLHLQNIRLFTMASFQNAQVTLWLVFRDLIFLNDFSSFVIVYYIYLLYFFCEKPRSLIILLSFFTIRAYDCDMK